jgi:hypothetical protein
VQAAGGPIKSVTPIGYTVHKVAFGGGVLVAAAGPDILTSYDHGFTWTNRIRLPVYIDDITFGNGRFVAVGYTNFFVSDPLTEIVAQRPAGSLRISGAIGHTHQIQAIDTLASNTWQVVTNIVLTNSPQVWIDPEATNRRRRFYRTELVP